jgi:peroxiredoxin Q/BCP
MARLIIGEKAPDFKLKDQEGNNVKLSDYYGKQNVVLFFYPKDFSPGCTAEVCRFRDSYDIFKERGAEVIGISADTEASHVEFIHKFGLQFRLLSDPDGKVNLLYEVGKTLGLVPGRVTFVIDKKMILRHIFSSQMNPTKHIQEALDILETV